MHKEGAQPSKEERSLVIFSLRNRILSVGLVEELFKI